MAAPINSVPNVLERNSPAVGAYVPTLSDSALQPILPRGIYVGTGGDVKVTMLDGNAVVFKNVPSGATLPVQAQIIWSTGTGASNLLVLY